MSNDLREAIVASLVKLQASDASDERSDRYIAEAEQILRAAVNEMFDAPLAASPDAAELAGSRPTAPERLAKDFLPTHLSHLGPPDTRESLLAEARAGLTATYCHRCGEPFPPTSATAHSCVGGSRTAPEPSEAAISAADAAWDAAPVETSDHELLRYALRAAYAVDALAGPPPGGLLVIAERYGAAMHKLGQEEVRRSDYFDRAVSLAEEARENLRAALRGGSHQPDLATMMPRVMALVGAVLICCEGDYPKVDGKRLRDMALEVRDAWQREARAYLAGAEAYGMHVSDEKLAELGASPQEPGKPK